MRGSSSINLGDGDNIIHMKGGISRDSSVTTGQDDDTFTYDFSRLDGTVNLGAGNDTFYYAGNNINGKVNAGAGNDTFVFTKSSQILFVDDTTGFERFDLKGTGGELNLKYDDLVNAEIKKVFVDGEANDTLDFLEYNWDKALTSDVTGYSKYIYSKDDQYIVYIDTDITNII